MDFGIEPLRFTNRWNGEWVEVSRKRNVLVLFLLNRCEGLETQSKGASKASQPGSGRVEMQSRIFICPKAAVFLFSKGLPASKWIFKQWPLCFKCHEVAWTTHCITPSLNKRASKINILVGIGYSSYTSSLLSQRNHWSLTLFAWLVLERFLWCLGHKLQSLWSEGHSLGGPVHPLDLDTGVS